MPRHPHNRHGEGAPPLVCRRLARCSALTRSQTCTQGAQCALPALAEIAAIDVLGLDWMTSGSSIRGAGAAKALQNKVIQGNMDPAALMAAPEEVAAHVGRIIDSFTVDGV